MRIRIGPMTSSVEKIRRHDFISLNLYMVGYIDFVTAYAMKMCNKSDGFTWCPLSVLNHIKGDLLGKVFTIYFCNFTRMLFIESTYFSWLLSTPSLFTLWLILYDIYFALQLLWSCHLYYLRGRCWKTLKCILFNTHIYVRHVCWSICRNSTRLLTTQTLLSA